MAGFYANVPADRMSYDLDGTQFYEIGDGGGEIAPYGNIDPIDRTGEISSLNNEDLSDIVTTNTSGAAFVLIFPEARDLQGSNFVWEYFRADYLDAETSQNSTNGVDGTWSSYAIGGQELGAKSDLRTIGAASALGVKALRFRSRFGGGTSLRNLAALHLYGSPASGENLQRLELWHPTLDQSLEAAAFDWGDVPRNTEEVRSFRVKNLHGSLTATTPRVATNILTDTSPSVPAQISFSDDNATWVSQLDLTDLGPGVISPLLYHRRVTPSDANIGLWWYRVLPVAVSWV